MVVFCLKRRCNDDLILVTPFYACLFQQYGYTRNVGVKEERGFFRLKYTILYSCQGHFFCYDSGEKREPLF